MMQDVPNMTVGFAAWILVTQFVNLAFCLSITRRVYGWTRTLGAYALGYLVPLALCLAFVPRLHGGVQGAAGALAAGFPIFFVLWGALTLALSTGSFGRRLFMLFVCGVHQLGAFVFGLLVMRFVPCEPLGAALAVAIMLTMGLGLLCHGLPRVREMDASAPWLELNLTAVMNFAMLFVTGLWPAYAPAGDLSRVITFLVANAVALAYAPIFLSCASKAKVEHDLQQAEERTRIMLAELRFARTEGSPHRCENPLVDAILAVSDRKADEVGKCLMVSAEVPAHLPMEDVDVVTLYGHLLENAIRHGKGSEIYVSTKVESGSLLRLMVSNRVAPGFRLVRGLPSESEGVGLASMRKVVEKYHGALGFELKNDELICRVVISPS